MDKGNVIHEGKAKIIYETSDPNQIIMFFKDEATARNGEKKGTIKDKGIINNKISTYFFKLLKDRGIENHYIGTPDARDMLVKKIDMIPLEVVVRNVFAGSIAARFGKEEGIPLPMPIVEFYYKNDALHDPLINRYHAIAFDIAKLDELNQIEHIAFSVNTILKEILNAKNVDLVDFKMEFGRDEKGKVILGDEISPDNCRFWDKDSKQKLDKDVFRHDLGSPEEAYQEMLRRLTEQNICKAGVLNC